MIDNALFRTLASTRSKLGIITDALIPLVPTFLLRATLHLPTQAFRLLQKNKAIASRVSDDLLKSRMETLKMGDESGRDLLSVLGMSAYTYFMVLSLTRLVVTLQ